MKRNEFEQKYLNKMVEVVLFDNDTFKGYLYSTNDYMNKTKLLDVKNHYFVGYDIKENGVRFRKSHTVRFCTKGSPHLFRWGRMSRINED